jgi:hypothetical protein
VRRRKPINPVPIHDHFDGSAHCVECGGPCKLTGADLLLTERIRWHLALLARQGWTSLPLSVQSTLEDAGADGVALFLRARQAETPA